MDLTPTDAKKKDPDSFSLDPENPDSYKKLSLIDSQQKGFASTLSPIASPKLRKIGSFSDELKPQKSPFLLDTSVLPENLKLTLNLCKSFNKEIKTVNGIAHFISALDENLRNTEHILKKQEKKIEEFFQEIYDQFIKNFHKITESCKFSLKSKLQQEFIEYRNTHDILKNNLESLLQNDSFSKTLEEEMHSLIQQNSSNKSSILENVNNEINKNDLYQNLTNFLNTSLEAKYGMTPLVKKFNLIEYITGRNDKIPFSSSISPNIADMKKEPFKAYINIYGEIESFISRISATFSHELSSISHPYANYVSIVEKVAKAPSKIFTIDSTGKFISNGATNEIFESYALQKRLGQGETENSILPLGKEELILEPTNKDRKHSGDNERGKSPNTPRLSQDNQISPKATTTLTPMKTVNYKIAVNKENNSGFCESISNFSEDNTEISFKTQLISVHNNLSIGDLVSYNGSPYRILQKEWSFPQDVIKMVNIFTGEKRDKTYHSRHEKEIEQIITKKYSMIKICDKHGYCLLMDMGWEKYENLRRLPKIFDLKNILDKKLEEEIKEALETNKKVCVHLLSLKDEEIIVSYRKEWL